MGTYLSSYLRVESDEPQRRVRIKWHPRLGLSDQLIERHADVRERVRRDRRRSLVARRSEPLVKLLQETKRMKQDESAMSERLVSGVTSEHPRTHVSLLDRLLVCDSSSGGLLLLEGSHPRDHRLVVLLESDIRRLELGIVVESVGELRLSNETHQPRPSQARSAGSAGGASES